MSKKHIKAKPKTEVVAKIYIHPAGRFACRDNGNWSEYPEHGSKPIHKFKEIRRDKKYVYLKDGSRRKDSGRPMLLRLPVAGGIAQWSWPNPLKWENFTIVEPKL